VSSSAGDDAVSPFPKNKDKSADVDQNLDELSDSGSEQADDPKDKSFGTSTRRKSATPKLSATRGRKRKVTGSASKIKRSRLSTDGGEDEEENTTNCKGVNSKGSQGRQVDGFLSTKVPTPGLGNTIRNPSGPPPSLSGPQNLS